MSVSLKIKDIEATVKKANLLILCQFVGLGKYLKDMGLVF